MLALHERFVVDAHGQPVEVILPIADYRGLLERLHALEAHPSDLPRAARRAATLALARGLLTTAQPAPTDTDVQRWLAERREEKYA